MQLNIYINDIPKLNETNKSFSNLYADDLNTSFFFTPKTIKQSEKKINNYLLELQKWLSKWKLKMSAHKCTYTIFSKNKKQMSSFNFNIKLFGDEIPRSFNPTFLGVTLDPTLCFNKHISKIYEKALDRLNIIKILSNKSWKLTSETLFGIYKALVGSIFNYSSFCANLISNKWMHKLQVIQNSAIRYIFKLPFNTSSIDLNGLASAFNLQEVRLRMFNLNSNYILKSYSFSYSFMCR